MLRNASIKLVLFYVASILFMLLNAYFIVKKDSFLINTLPFALVIVLLAVFSIKNLIYIIIFFTPFSLPLHEIYPGLSFDMYLPTEPLLFGILLIFILKLVKDRGFDREIIRHPITIVIFINLIWIAITSLTSTIPIVSLKFLLARFWFLAAFYFIAIKIFEKGKNIENYVWLYTIPLIVVVLYATYRHLGYGLWDKEASHSVVRPFYNDHTSYGALLAMYVPFLFGFSFIKGGNHKIKMISRVVLMVLIAGLILSYSRAAWLSIIGTFVIWGIIKLKIRFKPLFITFLTLLAFFLVFQSRLLMYLERNSEESSANIFEHVSSMSNITTDASNMERINRWSCAIRMFKEKPVFGYGPGTYMFKYAPFQLTKDRTIISTNAGDGGNAHSEYLGPLAESGVLGLLTFLIFIGVVVYIAIRAYSQTKDIRLKMIVLSALTGLITYYFHGIMNNFLDTDKASVPFWGFTAMIVAIDLYNRKQSSENKKPNQI